MEIDRATWSILEPTAAFRRIHEQKIVKVSYQPSGNVRLSGTSYVGTALCGDVALNFVEKVDGAMLSLLSFASHGSFHAVHVQGGLASSPQWIELLVGQFVASVAAYASQGRRFTYTTVVQTGSLAGGGLQLGETIRLRARGLGHLLAFRKQQISYRIPLNIVILATLSEIERISQLFDVSDELRRQSRGLALLFSDCRDTSILLRKRSFVADIAIQQAENERQELQRDISTLASIILNHSGFEVGPEHVGTTPRTWFVNLETLFEEAVRALLARCLPAALVSNGKKVAKPVFASTGLYSANPDVVIEASSGEILVGDVKYKKYDGSASSSDVYQLLAHSQSFGSTTAFLVYPSDSFFEQRLGKSSAGVSMAVFGVRVNQLPEDLRELISRVGLQQG